MIKSKQIINFFFFVILSVVFVGEFRVYCDPGRDDLINSDGSLSTVASNDDSDDVSAYDSEYVDTAELGDEPTQDFEFLPLDEFGDEDGTKALSEETEKSDAGLDDMISDGEWGYGSKGRVYFLRDLQIVNAMLRRYPGCQQIEGRYAIVGDIHGDSAIFNNLIDSLNIDIMLRHIEGVVFLGDFWDRNDGDVEVFERLIKFAAFHNKRGKYKVVILRGNHETPSFVSKFGEHFKEYMNRLDLDEEFDAKEEISVFYKLIPFNVIINKKIYAVHGGLPYIENGKSGVINPMMQLITTERSLYPDVDDEGMSADLLYLSVWLRFKYELIESELKPLVRGENGIYFFGPKHVESSLRMMNSSTLGLDIRTVIRGHDHPGSLSSFACDSWKGTDGKDYCVCRVITCTDLCADNVGSVALVVPESYKPIRYYRTYYDYGMALVQKQYINI